jgi:hypothetical protein
MDAYLTEDSCSARSAQFVAVPNKEEFKDVTNVTIFHVNGLTSFPCRWGNRLFCEPFHIGEYMEPKNGSEKKMSGIAVLNVDKGCFEAPDSVNTARCQWMWIDHRACKEKNP